MKRIRNFLFTMLALGHFGLIGLGVLHVRLPGATLWRAQVLYSRITGAGGSFGFFSPNVPREIDAEFDVDRPGRRIEGASLQDFYAPEVRTRLGNMVRMLGNNFKEEKVTRSIAAALAVNLWRHFPDARAVTLRASLYKLPDLRDYRAGQVVAQVPVYSATFRKAGRP